MSDLPTSAASAPRAAVGRPPRPPRQLDAVPLMLARAALSLLGLLALPLTRDDLRDRIVAAEPGSSPRDVDAALSLGIGFAVVLGLLLCVAYVLLALQVSRGRGWARTVTLALAGLSVLAALSGLGEDAPALSRVLAVAGLALDAGIIALLVSRPAAQHVRRTP